MRKRQRKKFWQDLALEWNFRYRCGDPYEYCSREEFPLFEEGHSRRVDHLIEGEVNGHAMTLFDYTYKIGSGKHQTTHHLTGLIFTTSIIGHKLVVSSENFMHRIAAFLGFDDINFEYEEFNRAFQVKCDDKKFAYDVFHTEMMDYLLQYRSLSMEWCLNQILFYHSSKHRIDKAEAEQLRAFAQGFVKRLPQYLLDQQRGE